METVLISGGLGTIGINTANYLLKNNFRVICVDNCIGNPIERVNEIKKDKNFKFYKINYNNEYQYIFKNEKIDKVLHLASIIGSMCSNNDIGYFNNNEQSTIELLELSKNYNINRFVLASSSSVYGECDHIMKENDRLEPLSIYGITKANSEKYVNYYNKIHNLNTVILRYFNVYANIKYYGYRSLINLFSEKIINDEFIYINNNGKSKRQYIHIDDIVLSNYLALTHNKAIGEIFNVTVDEEPISLIELLNILQNKLNKYVNYEIRKEKTLGDVNSNWGDNSKIKNLLGFKLKYNLLDSIDNYVNYILNEKH